MLLIKAAWSCFFHCNIIEQIPNWPESYRLLPITPAKSVLFKKKKIQIKDCFEEKKMSPSCAYIIY